MIVLVGIKDVYFHSSCRLVCKISEKTPNLDLNITLEVHEGEVRGPYSIEGTAQTFGFSFVVGMAAIGPFFCEMLIYEN